MTGLPKASGADRARVGRVFVAQRSSYDPCPGGSANKRLKRVAIINARTSSIKMYSRLAASPLRQFQANLDRMPPVKGLFLYRYDSHHEVGH